MIATFEKLNSIGSSLNLTVNLHLTNRCNYKCSFCYAHFKDSKNLSKDDLKEILYLLKDYGVHKVNFAGGEPFLFKGFEELLIHAKELGLKTSIISNGSMIKREWIFEYGKYLDILGISCDSANPLTLKLLGRGNGSSAFKTK